MAPPRPVLRIIRNKPPGEAFKRLRRAIRRARGFDEAEDELPEWALGKGGESEETK